MEMLILLLIGNWLGCNRLPSYMKRVRQGVLDPKAQIDIKQITPVVSQIDGKNGELPSPNLLDVTYP